MSEEKPPGTDAEKPQSPSVVKSSTDTKAKPKPKPAAKPRAISTEASVETPRGNTPEGPVEIAGGNSPAHVETPATASTRDFLDETFDLFGWGD
jgi:hypothetical protein